MDLTDAPSSNAPADATASVAASNSSAPSSTALSLLPGDKKTAEEEDPLANMTLFSTRRPRNLSAGVSSGLKSVAKGAAMGAVGLVAAPVLGAKEGGVKGFLAGLGAGVLGAVTLPAYGAIVGGVQVARGALNTPEAFSERGKGKIWDEDTRQWVAYDLQTDSREVLSQTEEEWCKAHGISAEGGSKVDGTGRGGAVKETELYETLGVSTDASASAIRKAYFRLAKELHPDKNLDDPEAHDKFQKVGEAYQVLSNDEMRAKYDASGKAALEASSLIDPTSYFAMLFGSEPFEYLVGELRLATLFLHGGEANEEFMAYKQKRRELLCAVTLTGLLSEFEYGDEAEFEAHMHDEAAVLQKAPVGVALIWTCGYIYEHKGLQALGGLDAVGSTIQQKVHDAAANLRVAGAAIKTYRAFVKDVKKEKKEEKEKDKDKKKDTDGDVAAEGGDDDGSDAVRDTGKTAQPPPLQVGAHVTIQGLVSRPELNRYSGLVVAWSEEKERFMVELDGSGERLLLKPANLWVTLDGTDAHGGSGDGGSSGGKRRHQGNASGAADGGGTSASGGDSGSDSKTDGEAGEEGGEGGPSEDTMLLMFESMWRVSLLDIESTLRHACNKVLSDLSVTKERRRTRARGLVVMGRVFQSYGSSDALKTMDFKQHMQDAGVRMAEKMAKDADREAGFS
jgi:hypothetical protein